MPFRGTPSGRVAGARSARAARRLFRRRLPSSLRSSVQTAPAGALGDLDPVEGAGARAVAPVRTGQRRNRVEEQAAQAFGVLAEDPEHLLLGHPVLALHTGVKIG